MRINRILLIGFGFFFPFFLLSQIPEGFSKSGNSAELKQKIRESSASTSSISSDFKQEKHLTMMEEVLVSEGRFLFRKENNVRWEYHTPINYAIIIRDDLFTINNDGKISDFSTESNKLFKEVNNMIVMAIKGDFVENPDFDVSFFEDDRTYLARLKPNDEILGDILEYIEIKFSKANTAVTEVKFIEPGEDYTRISFYNRKANIEIDDDQFQVQ